MENYMEQIVKDSILDKLLNYKQEEGRNSFTKRDGTKGAYILDKNCLMVARFNDKGIIGLEFSNNVEIDPTFLKEGYYDMKPRLEKDKITYSLDLIRPKDQEDFIIATMSAFSLDATALVEALVSTEDFCGKFYEIFLDDPNTPAKSAYWFIDREKFMGPVSSEGIKTWRYDVLNLLSGKWTDGVDIMHLAGEPIYTFYDVLTTKDVVIDYKSVPLYKVSDNEICYKDCLNNEGYDKISLVRKVDGDRCFFQITRDFVIESLLNKQYGYPVEAETDPKQREIIEAKTIKEAVWHFSKRCAQTQKERCAHNHGCGPGQKNLVQRIVYKKTEAFLMRGRGPQETKTQTPKPIPKTKKKDVGLSK